MTSSLQGLTKNNLEQYADYLVSQFMQALKVEDLPNFTKLTDKDCGAETSIDFILKDPVVCAELSQLNGIKNLPDIVSTTLYLTKAKDGNDRNILHIAIERKDDLMVKLIIHLAPNLINKADRLGQSPLFVAAVSGYKGIVRCLLDPSKLGVSNGADTQICENSVLDTPLHAAALRGFQEISRMLKNAGADLNAENKYGFTPGDCVRRQLFSFNKETGITLQQEDPVRYKRFQEMEVELAPTKRALLDPRTIAERLGMKAVNIDDIRKKA